MPKAFENKKNTGLS